MTVTGRLGTWRGNALHLADTAAGKDAQRAGCTPAICCVYSRSTTLTRPEGTGREIPLGTPAATGRPARVILRPGSHCLRLSLRSHSATFWPIAPMTKAGAHATSCSRRSVAAAPKEWLSSGSSECMNDSSGASLTRGTGRATMTEVSPRPAESCRCPVRPPAPHEACLIGLTVQCHLASRADIEETSSGHAFEWVDADGRAASYAATRRSSWCRGLLTLTCAFPGVLLATEWRGCRLVDGGTVAVGATPSSSTAASGGGSASLCRRFIRPSRMGEWSRSTTRPDHTIP
jgi:hypothetical protein